MQEFWKTVVVTKCWKYIRHWCNVIPEIVELQCAATGYSSSYIYITRLCSNKFTPSCVTRVMLSMNGGIQTVRMNNLSQSLYRFTEPLTELSNAINTLRPQILKFHRVLPVLREFTKHYLFETVEFLDRWSRLFPATHHCATA